MTIYENVERERFNGIEAYLSTLADVLETRFERTENLADLERTKGLRAQMKYKQNQ